MAVNPVVQAGLLNQSSAQVIDGSLKFDRDKSQYLSIAPSAGNRKTWTYSCWFKKTNNEISVASIYNSLTLFFTDNGSGGNWGGITFYNTSGTDGSIIRIAEYTSSYIYSFESNGRFRDPNAWMHIVVAVDTTIESPSTDRVKVYINGNRYTDWSSATYPTHNAETNINSTQTLYIGRETSNADYTSGTVTNKYFIDGQQLDASYFGFTDPLTNTWRPKKFKPQATPNNGTTWSSTGSDPNSKISSGSIANVFSGSLATGITILQSSSNEYVTMTTGPIQCNSTVSFLSANGASTATMRINGSDTYKFTAGSTTLQWWDFSFSGTITKIELGYLDGSGSANAFWGIMVDGVPLLDGDTTNMGANGFYLPLDGNSPIGEDKSGRGNNWTPVNFGGSAALDKATGALPILNTVSGGKVATVGVRSVIEGFPNVGTLNDGTVWNSGLSGTSGGSSVTITTPENAFDGGLTTKATFTHSSGNDSIITWTPPGGSLSGSNFRIYCYQPQGTAGAQQYLSINGGDYVVDTGNWAGVSANSDGWSTSQSIPGGTLTSIALKLVYSGASSQSIWAIEIDGEILVDGMGLRLALPLVGSANDVSNQINSGSSTKTITVNGTVTFPTTRSIFYESSLRTSSGNYLTASGGGSGGNFDFGSGDFTVECWANANSINASSAHIISAWSDPSSQSFAIAAGGGGAQDKLGAGVIINGTQYNLGYTTTQNTNSWYHFALVRNGSTVSFYINGVLNDTASVSGSITTPPSVLTIGTHSSSQSTYYFDGYIQDLRIYKGVAKYTSNFIPASTNPDILPDTPSGVSGSSKLTKVTDGAVAFDGTGDYLELADSADWDFGTGDFTVECFAYFNDTTSVNSTMINRWGTDAYIWTLQIVSSTQNLRFYTNSGNLATPSNSIGPNRWYHFAASRSSGTLKLFIDGVEKASSSFTVNLDGTSRLNVGAEVGNAALPTNGFISNARVIKGTALYTANFTPPSAPLTNVTNTKLLCCQDQTAFITGAQPILNTNSTGSTTTSGTRSDPLASYLSLCLPLNGSNGGTTFTDQSPTGRTTSALTFSSNGDPQTSTSQSKYYGSSGYFDGTGDYLTSSATGTTMTVSTGDFTIELWVYWNSFSGSPLLVSAGTGGFSLGSNTSGDIIMYRNGAGGWGGTWSSANMVTGQWYHIAAVTSTSGTWEVYLNGNSLGTQAGWTGEGTTSPLYIGGYGNGVGTQLPNAYIQDIRIYKGIRKYNSNFTVTAPSVEPTAAVSPSSLLGLGNAAATNFNPFTTDINTVRGQETGYATLNPLTQGSNSSLSNGNLNYLRTSNGYSMTRATISVSSGKWYYEHFFVGSQNNAIAAGIVPSNSTATYPGEDANSVGYNFNGTKVINTTQTSYGATYDAGDVVGVAFDADNGTVNFYKNGINQGTATSALTSGPYTAGVSGWGSGTGSDMNFGQKPFKFPPPEGFQPLNASNVRPSTVIASPDQYVGVATYSGTSSGGTTVRSENINFTPDLVWTKTRNATENHMLYDSVRGVNKRISTNNSVSEATTNTASDLSGFIRGGYTVGGQNGHINYTGYRHVAWCWKAGGNKNTFNVDDVGYSSASDVNMSSGDLTSSAYNQTSTWSNNWTASGNGFGSAPPSLTFDATLSNRLNNDAGGQIVTWDTTSYSLSGKLRIHCASSSGLYDIYVNGNKVADTPDSSTNGEWIDCGTFDDINEIQFAGTTYNTNTGLGSAGIYVYMIEVAGKILIDSGVTISAPSISSSGASVGTKQGFSIIKYGGDGSGTANTDSGDCFAHGLSQAPDFIIAKNLDSSNAFMAYHSSAPKGTMNLSSSANNDSSSYIWAQVPPTEHVVYLGNNPEINKTGNNYIAYCWHSVPGFSKFGKYTNVTGGPFIELGFRPAVILIKKYDVTGRSWVFIDGERDKYNVAKYNLWPNLSNGDTTTYDVLDILSNGFKVRTSTNGWVAESTDSYIYAAWAEAPAFNLFGAQSNAR